MGRKEVFDKNLQSKNTKMAARIARIGLPPRNMIEKNEDQQRWEVGILQEICFAYTVEKDKE